MIALLSLIQDNPVANSFDDLGKLLLGGMASAIVVAVAFIVVRFKLQDKKPPTSNFISISSPPSNPGE